MYSYKINRYVNRGVAPKFLIFNVFKIPLNHREPLTVSGSTVIYPSDATSTERAVELVANTKGICYIRTSRPNTPILYDANTKFEVGT